jgi:apolipoprotein N-acyltransferase
MQGLTPYAHLGEKPVLILLMILFLALLLPDGLFLYFVKKKSEN